MKITAIYKIQSIIKPERIYIGSAITINKRWIYHIWCLKNNKHHSLKLQNHVNKYGIEDLQFSILVECDKKELIRTEQYYIDLYNPYFNICKIAGSCLGHRHTEESKQKMKKPRSQEFKNKMRSIKLGKKSSKETREKQSVAAKKRPSNRKGISPSEKTKLLISKGVKKYYNKKHE